MNRPPDVKAMPAGTKLLTDADLDAYLEMAAHREPALTMDAFTLNSYECGCRIVSEHAGGLGAKTIAWCSLHKHAAFLLKATKRVHSAFTEGRNPTFDAVEKLATAIAACEFKVGI